MSNLDAFKSDVARLFFSLPASDGYLLAGGGALLATGISNRPTEDLDFFGSRTTREMSIVSRIFELAATRQGWGVRPVRRSEDFVRLQIRGTDSLAIDFCRDSPALLPVNHTSDGPTYAGPELAGRKMLALFGRAEARDFVDVFVLAKRFGRSTLFDDADLPIDQTLVPDLRQFFRSWVAELTA